MTSDRQVTRLIRRKLRLTQRLIRSDHRRVEKGRRPRQLTLLRTRLYRCDLLLEQARPEAFTPPADA